MGAAQILLRGLRNAPVQDFPLADQVGHYAGHLFGCDLRVDAVLVVEVYAVCAQTAERPLDRAADGRRTRIGNHGMRAARFGTLERYAEFGGDDDPVPKPPQGLAQQFFVVVRPVRRAVHLGRVEKGIAHLHGVGEQFRHFALVGRSAVGMAHAHAAQSHGRHSQSAEPQCSVIHLCFSPFFAVTVSASSSIRKPRSGSAPSGTGCYRPVRG